MSNGWTIIGEPIPFKSSPKKLKVKHFSTISSYFEETIQNFIDENNISPCDIVDIKYNIAFQHIFMHNILLVYKVDAG